MACLSYYMHDGPKAFRFQLSGSLAGVDASRIDQAWRTASSITGGEGLTIDVTSLTSIDGNGRALLQRWSQAGAHYIANSPASRSLVESITGHLFLVSGPATRTNFIASAIRAAGSLLIFAMTLLFPATASASNPATGVLERYEAHRSSGGMTAPTAAVEKTPRRKRLGTISGELWIDSESGLATHLSRLLVKIPSLQLRRAELTMRERVYAAEEVTENVSQ